jgi:hypothetical protein
VSYLAPGLRRTCFYRAHLTQTRSLVRVNDNLRGLGSSRNALESCDNERIQPNADLG